MKRILFVLALIINASVFSQTVQTFNIVRYTSYQAKGQKKFNEVIANSFNTIQKDYKITIALNYDEENEYLGHMMIYDENDFFGDQKIMQNRKRNGNSITFDINHYDWTKDGYMPVFMKSFKFSINNSFMPMVYFYNPLDDTTYLIKYETQE